MDHVGPDREPHGDVRRSRGSGQPNRVVEECSSIGSASQQGRCRSQSRSSKTEGQREAGRAIETHAATYHERSSAAPESRLTSST